MESLWEEEFCPGCGNAWCQDINGACWYCGCGAINAPEPGQIILPEELPASSS